MSVRVRPKNNVGNTDISFMYLFMYLIMGKVPDSGKQGHRLGLQTMRVPRVVMPKKSRESSLLQQRYVLRHGPKFTGRESRKSDYDIQTTQMRSKKCSAVRIKGIMEESDGQAQEDKETGVLT